VCRITAPSRTTGWDVVIVTAGGFGSRDSYVPEYVPPAVIVIGPLTVPPMTGVGVGLTVVGAGLRAVGAELGLAVVGVELGVTGAGVLRWWCRHVVETNGVADIPLMSEPTRRKSSLVTAAAGTAAVRTARPTAMTAPRYSRCFWRTRDRRWVGWYMGVAPKDGPPIHRVRVTRRQARRLYPMSSARPKRPLEPPTTAVAGAVTGQKDEPRAKR